MRSCRAGEGWSCSCCLPSYKCYAWLIADTSPVILLREPCLGLSRAVAGGRGEGSCCGNLSQGDLLWVLEPSMQVRVHPDSPCLGHPSHYTCVQDLTLCCTSRALALLRMSATFGRQAGETRLTDNRTESALLSSILRPASPGTFLLKRQFLGLQTKNTDGLCRSAGLCKRNVSLRPG